MKLISDPLKFVPIENLSIQKFTLKIEDKVNNFLRKIRKSELITEETYNKLFASGSTPGILYGLPKIHKIDFFIHPKLPNKVRSVDHSEQRTSD